MLPIRHDFSDYPRAVVGRRSALFSIVVTLSFYKPQTNPYLRALTTEFAPRLLGTDTSRGARAALQSPFLLTKVPVHIPKCLTRHDQRINSLAIDSNQRYSVPSDVSPARATIRSSQDHVHAPGLARTKMKQSSLK